MYKAFWHQYVLEHSHHEKSVLTVNPGPLFAAMVCLIVLMAWAAFQMQVRTLTGGLPIQVQSVTFMP